jgi:ankyrin repeat protein
MGAEQSTDETPKYNKTRLMLATIKNDFKNIEHFLNDGDSVSDKDELGRTLLHYVAEYTYASTYANKIIHAVLKNGGDLNVTDTLLGWTPLMLAVNDSNLVVVRTLLQFGADASIIDLNGKNALALARKIGERKITTLLQHNTDLKL